MNKPFIISKVDIDKFEEKQLKKGKLLKKIATTGVID